MPTQLNPVEGSSNIAGEAFDSNTGTLTVQFTNGRAYNYAGVSPDDYAAFANADSKGKAFASIIRPQYEGVLIPADDPDAPYLT